VRRREFITLLGGAAAWPLAVRAQDRERMRHIGVLMPFAEDNPQYLVRTEAFVQRLLQLGWMNGRNLRIDYRASTDRFRQLHPPSSISENPLRSRFS